MSDRSIRSRRLRLALLLAVLPAFLAGPGCIRRYYRNKADKEVEDILTTKSDDPRWDLAGYNVYPDPKARFGDVSNSDKPPMPPDDPGAKEYSPNPQQPGKAGVGLLEGTGYLDMLDNWDKLNREELAKRAADATAAGDAYAAAAGDTVLQAAEREANRELADVVTTTGTLPDKLVDAAQSQQRIFLLKLEQAVELGLINSREYQTRREQLYLAALPVTLERFAFAPQLFWAEEAFRERFGRQSPGGFANRWRLNSTAGFSQLFSTGALLLLSFANRTVYNLGNAPSTSVSQISLDFIQPLLRGAGRAVTLEPLTQAERNLLYAVRDFAKFRQEFFVYIAAGQPSFIPGQQAGVQAITSGTVGLPGFFVPSAAPLVFPITGAIIGPQVTPGDGARLADIGGPQAPPTGYLSTLTTKARLINQYRNIARLRQYLQRFRVYLDGGIVTSVQVGSVEQNLLRDIAQVLNSQASYRNSVDQFKLQLGLPMQLRLDFDDDPLRPMFNLTERYEQIINESERVSEQAQDAFRPADVPGLRGRLRKLLVGANIVRGTAFGKTIAARLAELEKLPQKPRKAGEDSMDTRLERLRKQRDDLRERREKLREKDRGDLPPDDARRLERLEAEVDLASYEQSLRSYEARPWAAIKDDFLRAEGQRYRFNVILRWFLAVIEEAIRERNEAVRRLWPALPSLCVDGVDLLRDDDDKVLAAASRAALVNRLDLMNQRAQLVDSWRKIAVTANSLLGTLDVAYRLDAFTPLGGSQPLNFSGSRSQNRLIVNFEAPLVRIIERNNYRAALIAYQNQRRQLQLAEDQVLFAVRLELRQLRATANNYHKIQKRAIELAYQQVDQALQAFSQPQAPAGPAAPPGLVGPPVAGGGANDPAALTQQLLQAQNSLLQAQNDLYNTWIGYITTRMSLYRDLGLMPLDPRGVWIDDVATCHCPPTDRPQGPADDSYPKLPAVPAAGPSPP